MDRGGGRGGHTQAIDWLARYIFEGRGEQDLNKYLAPQFLSQGRIYKNGDGVVPLYRSEVGKYLREGLGTSFTTLNPNLILAKQAFSKGKEGKAKVPTVG